MSTGHRLCDFGVEVEISPGSAGMRSHVITRDVQSGDLSQPLTNVSMTLFRPV